MKKALRIVLKPAVFALFAIVCSFFFTNEVKAGDLLINCDGGVRSVSRDPEKDLVDTVYLVFYNKKSIDLVVGSCLQNFKGVLL